MRDWMLAFWKKCRSWYLCASGHDRSFKRLVYVNKALDIKIAYNVLVSKKKIVNAVLVTTEFLKLSPDIDKSKGIF